MAEAEIGVKPRNAQGHWQPPKARRRQGGILSWPFSGGHVPADTLVFAFWIPELRD